MAVLAAATGAEVTSSGPAAGRRLAGLLSAPSSQAHVLLLFEGRPPLILALPRRSASRSPAVTHPGQSVSQLCYALGPGGGGLSPVSQLLLRSLA